MSKETLEEAAERLYPENWESIMEGQHDSNSYERNAFIKGSKWQQERMYSEEDMRKAFKDGSLVTSWSDMGISMKYDTFEEWFEQFKKQKDDK
jgi:hypothetical protein